MNVVIHMPVIIREIFCGLFYFISFGISAGIGITLD
jgi:hypothetical protein